MAGRKKKPKANEPVRLCIDFQDMDAMLDYIADTHRGAAPFELDSLDLTRIRMSHTYIMKRQGDRPKALKAP
jgi:hypothetical protein